MTKIFQWVIKMASEAPRSTVSLVGPGSILDKPSLHMVGYLGKNPDSSTPSPDGCCPVCKAKGQSQGLRTYRINFTQSIFLCANPQCIYPLGYTPLDNIIANTADLKKPCCPSKQKKRTYSETSITSKPCMKKLKADASVCGEPLSRNDLSSSQNNSCKYLSSSSNPAYEGSLQSDHREHPEQNVMERSSHFSYASPVSLSTYKAPICDHSLSVPNNTETNNTSHNGFAALLDSEPTKIATGANLELDGTPANRNLIQNGHVECNFVLDKSTSSDPQNERGSLMELDRHSDCCVTQETGNIKLTHNSLQASGLSKRVDFIQDSQSASKNELQRGSAVDVSSSLHEEKNVLPSSESNQTDSLLSKWESVDLLQSSHNACKDPYVPPILQQARPDCDAQERSREGVISPLCTKEAAERGNKTTNVTGHLLTAPPNSIDLVGACENSFEHSTSPRLFPVSQPQEGKENALTALSVPRDNAVTDSYSPNDEALLLHPEPATENEVLQDSTVEQTNTTDQDTSDVPFSATSSSECILENSVDRYKADTVADMCQSDVVLQEMSQDSPGEQNNTGDMAVSLENHDRDTNDVPLSEMPSSECIAKCKDVNRCTAITVTEVHTPNDVVLEEQSLEKIELLHDGPAEQNTVDMAVSLLNGDQDTKDVPLSEMSSSDCMPKSKSADRATASTIIEVSQTEDDVLEGPSPECITKCKGVDRCTAITVTGVQQPNDVVLEEQSLEEIEVLQDSPAEQNTTVDMVVSLVNHDQDTKYVPLSMMSSSECVSMSKSTDLCQSDDVVLKGPSLEEIEVLQDSPAEQNNTVDMAVSLVNHNQGTNDVPLLEMSSTECISESKSADRSTVSLITGLCQSDNVVLEEPSLEKNEVLQDSPAEQNNTVDMAVSLVNHDQDTSDDPLSEMSSSECISESKSADKSTASTITEVCLPDNTNTLPAVEQTDIQTPCKELKYLQWRNKHSLCWLDCILSTLVHSSTIKNTVAEGGSVEDSIIHKLFEKYNEASSMMTPNDKKNKIGCQKKLNSAQKCLDEIRIYIFGKIKTPLKCELGNKESPVFAFPLLLQQDPKFKELFVHSFSWNFSCALCGYKYQERCQKTMTTFTNILPDWKPLNAVHRAPCNKCQDSTQKRSMTLERIHSLLMLHFVEGLPSNDLQMYSFQLEGHMYEVKTVIQYQGDHFATWIANGDGTWLESDDLKGPYCKNHKSFDVPSSEIHIVIWERNTSKRPQEQDPHPLTEEDQAINSVIQCSLNSSHPVLPASAEKPKDIIPESVPESQVSNRSDILSGLEGYADDDIITLNLIEIPVDSLGNPVEISLAPVSDMPAAPVQTIVPATLPNNNYILLSDCNGQELSSISSSSHTGNDPCGVGHVQPVVTESPSGTSTTKPRKRPPKSDSVKKGVVGSWMKSLMSKNPAFLNSTMCGSHKKNTAASLGPLLTVTDVPVVKKAQNFGAFKARGAPSNVSTPDSKVHVPKDSPPAQTFRTPTVSNKLTLGHNGMSFGKLQLKNETSSSENKIRKLRLKLLKKLKAKKNELATLEMLAKSDNNDTGSPMNGGPRASFNRREHLRGFLQELQDHLDNADNESVCTMSSRASLCSSPGDAEFFADLFSPSPTTKENCDDSSYLEMFVDNFDTSLPSNNTTLQSAEYPQQANGHHFPAGNPSLLQATPGSTSFVKNGAFDTSVSEETFNLLSSSTLEMLNSETQYFPPFDDIF